MSENKQNLPGSPAPDTDTQAGGPVNQSRRRLTGAGLGVSAIFTLASRPVLAGAGQCLSPSAACSGNLSQQGTPPSCTGVTPGYWKTHTGPGEWPSPYLPGSCTSSCNTPQGWSGGTAFHAVFSGSNFMVSGNSLSLEQVMVMNNSDYPGVTDPDNLGAHIVAALLNAAHVPSLTPVLTEIAVINMWNEWVANGYFEPQAGVHWNSAQIVIYLKTTMPL